MAKFSVSVPPELQHWVEARVTAEGYSDTSEFLRELICREHDLYQGRLRRLQAMIDEGIASGIIDEEPEDVIEQLIAEMRTVDG